MDDRNRWQEKVREIQAEITTWWYMKLAIVVKGDQNVPLSIVTMLRCRGECYSFPWVAPPYPWSIPFIIPSVKQGGILYFFFFFFFLVFAMTQLRIEPRSLGPLVNTLPTSACKRLIKRFYPKIISLCSEYNLVSQTKYWESSIGMSENTLNGSATVSGRTSPPHQNIWYY